jgi:hypothetical protein
MTLHSSRARLAGVHRHIVVQNEVDGQVSSSGRIDGIEKLRHSATAEGRFVADCMCIIAQTSFRR